MIFKDLAKDVAPTRWEEKLGHLDLFQYRLDVLIFSSLAIDVRVNVLIFSSLAIDVRVNVACVLHSFIELSIYEIGWTAIREECV